MKEIGKMKLNTKLVVNLSGEFVDSENLQELRNQIDKLLEQKYLDELELDLSGVKVIKQDIFSGFLMGRNRKASKEGILVCISNPSEATDKILNDLGVYDIIPKKEVETDSTFETEI